MFYLIQYSISNLNAFILLITIGYSLYCYVSNSESKAKEPKVTESTANEKQTSDENSNNLQDVNNSPIQLIDQLKGLYYINPVLSLSLAITLFSFAGIPPLIGFFGKQMILSAAIDNGYIFMSLVAILTRMFQGGSVNRRDLRVSYIELADDMERAGDHYAAAQIRAKIRELRVKELLE